MNRLCCILWLLLPAILAASAPTSLKVSANQRYLVDRQDKPFFYLADTAWELFHRLNEKDADVYLSARAEQGFTVIQCVILAECDGLRVPNANGDLPLIDCDPAKPNEPYFKHVDRLVDRMQAKGLVAGLLPTWGDKWNQAWGKGPKEEWKHIAVTSDRTPGQKDATYIMAYFPHHAEASFDTSVLDKPRLSLAWFDPRTGITHEDSTRDNTGQLTVKPPSDQHPVDWVLVLTGKNKTP
jgi:hypothetical protein